MENRFARAVELLKVVFGYQTFRLLQEECINTILSKRDTLLLMPTGGGKSLCYQIPALLFEGLTVVISPLISLMQDQVQQLKALGIEAEFLNSTLSWEEYRMNKWLVKSGRTRILFMAPETVFKEDIFNLLSSMEVDCIVIDEAHCISEWGHDFRPEYRELVKLRDALTKAVWLAMTATATPRVRNDIRENLQLQNPKELIASFNRENLFYEVIPKVEPLKQLLDFLKRFVNQSGIIYCFSRRQVDSLTAQLNKWGFQALSYHAGLDDKERRHNQDLFIRDDVQIMVATIAFGMGINKPNVRFVVHYDLPKNIESYYQETGRSGRDGLIAHCLLLFGYGDIYKIKYLIEQKSNPLEKRIAHQHLQRMIDYAQTEGCRRIPLITYFGQPHTNPQCGCCDNCLNPKLPDYDLTPLAKKFFLSLLRTGQRFGALHVIDVLRGSSQKKVLQYEHHELDVYGAGKELTVKQWAFVLRQLMQRGFIQQREDSYGVLKLTPQAYATLNGQGNIMGFAPPSDIFQSKGRKEPRSLSLSYDERLFARLREKRKQLADENQVPPYIIFSDKSLIEMCQIRPLTKESFAKIYGVGMKKLNSFADDFISVIRDYCNNIRER